ncbi:Permease of the drug/metabolite transporter (DMT) superfamily [Carboxydocella thermautotrophica]|nr:Permease of the drug/metabolite transporter (DMT) superfamily [Carboxydocella thermautotrophica]
MQYLLLVLTAFFWGGAFIAGKVAVKTTPPFVVAFLRFLIAGILLLLLLRRREGWPDWRKKENFSGLFFLGLTGVFGYNLLFFEALKHTSPVNGSLIVAANPGVTALINRFWHGERLGPRRWLGILLSFTGVTLVICRGDLELLANLRFNFGDILLVGATLCWALYSIKGKEVMNNFTPLAATAFACTFGALLLLPFALWQGGQQGWSWLGQAQPWLAIIFLAIFASVLGFVWWYQGVQAIGASRAAIFINLVPISVMLMSALQGEKLTWVQLLGAALVLGGVYLTSMAKVQPGRAH